ncbi:MAG: 1-phosphofructokinase family hexose kinase [Mycoplasma sp.]|nr:1-phosphofructokinase family hexose kinase [Mycoplasma sp.]
MIYTITFSPSIDYVINTKENFDQNDLNRVDNYEFLPGGKGINASIVLKRIGFENKAITFLGGSTKNLFLDLMNKEKVDFINFDSTNDTRINVKMFANNSTFEINGTRAKISNDEYEKLLNLIDKLDKNDFVFIMGICEEEFLKKLVEKIHSKGIKFALDIDSKVVLDLLKYNPFIIKPNRSELESLLNTKINSIEDMKKAMISLKSKGLQNLMVSDGGKGSYFISEDNKCYQITLKKKFDIVSTVGAGDTLISSFTSIYYKSNDVIRSLKEATSLSIGTSCTRFLASKEDQTKYIDDVEVKEI